MGKQGFTLMELLIVVGLVAAIAVAALVLLNPWAQMGKGYDARRKHDLNQLQHAFEEYYNDTGCYPRTDVVCFDSPKNVCSISKTVTSKLCHICGREAKPTGYAAIKPYLSELPCDPEHPAKDYLYEVDRPGCGRDPASCNEFACTATYCPKWYRVYSDLSSKEDADSKTIGCYGGGCGPTQPPVPTPVFGYDYGIYSPNIYLEKSDTYVCLTPDNRCNSCGYGGYQKCVDQVTSGGCQSMNKIYSLNNSCCTANPSACP